MRRATLITVLAVLAAACGGDAAPTTTSTSTPVIATTVPATTPTTAIAETPGAEGPIVVWVPSEDVADAVIARADVFTAETGIGVFVVTIVSAPDDDRLFLDELIAGEIPEPPEGVDAPDIPAALRRMPDIVIGPHTWLPELAAAGLAAPVELPEGLPAGAVEAVALRGFTIGVPVALDALVQYRNPARMAVAPADVSDVACAEDVACLLLPGDGDPDVHLPFLLTLGGYVFGPDPVDGYSTEDIGVGSTEAIASSAVLQKMVEDGTTSEAADRGDARDRFEAGDAALIWDGAEVLGRFSDAVIESLPTIGSSPAVSPVWVTAVWINASSELETEAALFAVDHLGSIQGSTAIARALDRAPVWAEGATDAERLLIEAAAAGSAVPYIARAEIAWTALAEAFARIHDGVDAGEALGTAADTIKFAD